MRYIKVFILVLIFFLVMMFFVQNQGAFADPVTLRLDLLFLPSMESIPMPIYALMLICFATGAFIVLLMLMWDRITLSGRLASAKRRISTLEKKLSKADTDLQSSEAAHAAAEEKLRADLADAESRVTAALRAATPTL